MPLFTQPCSGGWHWPVPKEGHQEDVQEEDPEEVQGQAFPEGESQKGTISNIMLNSPLQWWQFTKIATILLKMIPIPGFWSAFYLH